MPKNRKSGENPIFRLYFSHFHPGTYFGTYLVFYFGPKARNLFSSRPSGSQALSHREKTRRHMQCPPPHTHTHTYMRAHTHKAATWGMGGGFVVPFSISLILFAHNPITLLRKHTRTHARMHMHTRTHTHTLFNAKS